MHSRARPCLFFVLDFARSPTDANLQTHALRALPAGVRRATRLPESSSNCGPSSWSCMPCKMSCTSSRLSSPFVSAVPLAVRRPLATWSLLAITLGCCLVLVLRLDKASWLLNPYYGSLRPIRPQLLTASGLLLCPINHHLLIEGIFP